MVQPIRTAAVGAEQFGAGGNRDGRGKSISEFFFYSGKFCLHLQWPSILNYGIQQRPRHQLNEQRRAVNEQQQKLDAATITEFTTPEPLDTGGESRIGTQQESTQMGMPMPAGVIHSLPNKIYLNFGLAHIWPYPMKIPCKIHGRKEVVMKATVTKEGMKWRRAQSNRRIGKMSPNWAVNQKAKQISMMRYKIDCILQIKLMKLTGSWPNRLDRNNRTK